ncbi:ABC transporter permease [Paenibacillus doosanensis]|uniref:ABC-2 family transporter protein n=1 Tax=Paenibacillus konkukensis TaxID=2020716 RepID=A0ABY4RVS3_9BACL|nr:MULTISPECIES: ABC transporter permease [Paenibacillus]MCS7460732.1 ABC transporter permease [Paenibacillus doosanensis]UQZ85915.1 ABC-2 family transporter protein [Paenibacillus konkukensis]
MSNFLSLVQNEQMKIYNRTRTWIMFAIVLLAVVLMAIMLKYVIGSGMNHAFSFVAMCTSMSWLVFLFSVIVAGDSVASEFTWGTIKLLLIRPATRSKILAAKYVSVVLLLVTLLLFLLIVSYFVGLLFFGLSGPVAEQDSFPRMIQTYGIKFIDLLMYVTLAFMISAAFRSSSLAIGLSICLMFTANTIVLVLASLKYTWVKYILFANTDLSPYLLGDKPPIAGMTLGFSVTMLVLYWIVFYAVSWLLFTKRDVAG